MPGRKLTDRRERTYESNSLGSQCLLLASSGIEPEIVERASALAVVSDMVLPVAQVEELLAMKVLAAADDRPQDTMDFQNLVLFNPDYVQATVYDNLRLVEARGYASSQDLLAKYRQMHQCAAGRKV